MPSPIVNSEKTRPCLYNIIIFVVKLLWRIMMFKKAGIILASLVFGFYAMQSFAISPGAAQAQIRNNTQEMQQNKQWLEHHKKRSQNMIQYQKKQIQPRDQ